MLFLLLGDYKSPGVYRSNLFLRRISNPPGHLVGLPWAWASALSGRVGQILLLPFTFPLGVPPDLESGVKKCPNLFRLCGFVIRSKGVCLFFCWGIANPPGRLSGDFLFVCHHNATLPIPAISKLAEIPIALKTLAMVANVILFPFSILETCDFFTPISVPSSS